MSSKSESGDFEPALGFDFQPDSSTPSDDSTPSEAMGLGSYAGNRRALLESLSVLHSTGIETNLPLPQIAVVGSQSAGKSSLIESMSGLSLPRDTGTCTRCPMECLLQTSPEWSCSISLRFDFDQLGDSLSQRKTVNFGPPLKNKADVEKMLRRAQRAILRPTLDSSCFLDDADLAIAGHPAQTFSRNCVCIRVEGPDVPDLYFYDLPGIIANVAEGGNEGDIKLVEDLVRSYIDRPDCIVLLVTSCETDFENQGAGRIVLKNPSLRERTVGVLTKVDRIERGTGDKWLGILKGEESQLSRGWFAVKQPDLEQRTNGITRAEARSNERSFFETDSTWSTLGSPHRRHLGTPALSEHLGELLSDLVAERLPAILADVLQQLRDVKGELSDMPEPIIDDPKHEVVRLFRNFTKDVSKHVEGVPPACTADPSDPFDAGLIYSINNAYEKFRDEVHRTVPQFHPWCTGFQPNHSMLKEATKDDPLLGCKGEVFFIDKILDLAKRSRTRELPGNYPFAVKVTLVDEALRIWKKLAKECFTDIEEILVNHIDHLVRDHFGRFAHGGLMDAVSRIIRDQIQKRLEVTNANIDGLCKGEKNPYTQNEDYFFASRSKMLGRYKSLYRQSQGAKINMDEEQVRFALSSLARLGIQGLVADDLFKLLPADDKMEPALEIMAEVRAYFQVAYKRFADTIPNQIDSDFVRGFEEALDYALMYMDLDRDQCARWLRESPHIVRRRKELVELLKRLETCKQALMPTVQMLAKPISRQKGAPRELELSPPSTPSSPPFPPTPLPPGFDPGPDGSGLPVTPYTPGLSRFSKGGDRSLRITPSRLM